MVRPRSLRSHGCLDAVSLPGCADSALPRCLVWTSKHAGEQAPQSLRRMIVFLQWVFRRVAAAFACLLCSFRVAVVVELADHIHALTVDSQRRGSEIGRAHV